MGRLPGLPETLRVTTDEQLRAVSNLTRHRIMAVLRFEPATITQIAERVGLAKRSSSYHVRLLERAGLVKVVRTRKVRGVTERYYAMAARTIALPDPGEGAPDVLMRHAVADLEASPTDGEGHVRMAHLRLTEEQFAELGARLQALADEYPRPPGVAGSRHARHPRGVVTPATGRRGRRVPPLPRPCDSGSRRLGSHSGRPRPRGGTATRPARINRFPAGRRRHDTCLPPCCPRRAGPAGRARAPAAGRPPREPTWSHPP